MLSRFRTRGMDLFYYKSEQTEKGLASSLNVTPCDLSFQEKAESLSVVMSHCGDVKNVKKTKQCAWSVYYPIWKIPGPDIFVQDGNCLVFAGWLVDAMRTETIT